MKILIYGAGTIGCLYAVLFSKAGYDITVYARGNRLESLQINGLLYESNGEIQKADVRIIGTLEKDDIYDFIFATVKGYQIHTVLRELSANGSPNIVTMVNTLEPYSEWEKLCGKGRLIPAFPGAGGSIENGVLKAALTPRIIQPTTFAEIDGSKSERLSELMAIFRKSKIPFQIVKDMHCWQLCHLAMVIPIADAYYKAVHPETVWNEKVVMLDTARQLKANFWKLYDSGIALSPVKMNLFRIVPISVLKAGLTATFKSKFGHIFMYKHSMNAPEEMRQLHKQFYQYIENSI